MGFVPCDARVLAVLPDSTSSRSRRTTIFLKKAGSLERTAFVHSSVQRRNKTLWVLWKCSDTWKLFYYFFFYRKDKAKLCFLQQVLFVVKGCNFNIKTLKPSMTEQVFFFFPFNGYCAWSEYNIMKCLKFRGVLYIKEENFDCKYVSWKKYWLYLFSV